jgi:hypothetical protein
MSGGFHLAAEVFTAYVVLTALLLRVSHRRSPAVIAVLCAVGVYAAGLAISIAWGDPVSFWAYSSAFWCAVGAFLMAFGATYKSISLRMIDYLFHQPGHAAAYDEVMRKYLSEETFENRLELIQSQGFARRVPEGLVLTRKGRSIASATHYLHALFGIQKSG